MKPTNVRKQIDTVNTKGDLQRHHKAEGEVNIVSFIFSETKHKHGSAQVSIKKLMRKIQDNCKKNTNNQSTVYPLYPQQYTVFSLMFKIQIRKPDMSSQFSQ